MIQFASDGFTLQAGAGIVADSVPEMEYQEIQHKAAYGIAALKAATEGLVTILIIDKLRLLHLQCRPGPGRTGP